MITSRQSTSILFLDSIDFFLPARFPERVNILRLLDRLSRQLGNDRKRLPGVSKYVGSWKHAIHRVNKMQDSRILDSVYNRKSLRA